MPDLKHSESEHLRDLMRQREQRVRTLRLQIAIVFALFTATLTVLTLFRYSELNGNHSNAKADLTAETEQKLISGQRDIESLRMALAELKKEIAIKPSALPGDAIAADLTRIDRETKDIDGRLKLLESSILENPEKALSIPMLRKDISEMTSRENAFHLEDKGEMDRLYDQQKWMLGEIGAVFLALTGGALTIILKSLPGKGKASNNDI